MSGFTLALDFGRIKVALDGQPLYGDKHIDPCDQKVQLAKSVILETLQLSPGKKRLTLKVNGQESCIQGLQRGT